MRAAIQAEGHKIRQEMIYNVHKSDGSMCVDKMWSFYTQTVWKENLIRHFGLLFRISNYTQSINVRSRLDSHEFISVCVCVCVDAFIISYGIQWSSLRVLILVPGSYTLTKMPVHAQSTQRNRTADQILSRCYSCVF